MDFFYSYLILVCIYVPVAMSTGLLVGSAGIFSVSQAAIFGIGAYTVGALTIHALAPFWVALLLAMGICAIINVLLSLPALRVAGDYFVVTSFGLQLVASTVFESWKPVTGGTVGLPGIPMPEFMGASPESNLSFLLLVAAVVAVLAVVYHQVRRSSFGRLLSAIRQDELAVAAAGKSVIGTKVKAAAAAGAFAAVGGAFYASYVSFIDPYSFDLQASILIIAMVVVGGARTLGGAIVGPALITGLPLLLTFVDIPSSYAAPARQLLYGVLLIVFMFVRPQGIVGESRGTQP
jgi:branched-chain amino acid transport system permease protein